MTTLVNGGTPKTKVPEYWDGEHSWITPAEMGKRASPFVDETARTLTDLGLADSSARMVPPHSVILSSRAPIGHLVINTIPMAFNQGCKGLVPDNALDHKFLYYYLSSIVDELNDLGTGATFKELSGGRLKEVKVPVPPLSEQHRIVAILDEAFAGITAAQEGVGKNLINAGRTLEAALGSTFRDIPSDWSHGSLGELVRFIDYRGRTPKKTSEGMRLITAKNVKMGILHDDPCEFVDPDIYDSWMTRGIPRRDDVLFTTEAPLANVAQLDTDDRVVFAQRIIVLQPTVTQLDPTFLKYQLMSGPVQSRIHKQATGATVSGIKASLLKLVSISFPKSVSSQRQLARRLSQIEAEASRLESVYRRKLAALDELKQSLLHHAFTGQL